MKIIHWLIVISFVGCKSQQGNEASKASGQKSDDITVVDTKKDPPSPTPTDESVTIPAAITGVLLTCSVIVPPVLSTSQVGCRLSDEKGARIDPATLGASVSYAPIDPPSGIKVIQKNSIIPERNYDTIFELSSADQLQLESAMPNMVYKVAFTDGNSTSLGSKIFDKNSPQFPALRADWIAKGEVGAFYFIDKTSSLSWAVDDGLSYNFDQATEHCAAMVYAGADNWRVPSIMELLSAHLDEIGTAFPQPDKMNIDSSRFGGYITTALTLESFGSIFGLGNKRLSINFSKPSFLGLVFGQPDVKKSIICVHD